MRCTFVARERLFRRLQGKPALSHEEEEIARKIWAASIATTMLCELAAIVFARILFIATFRHRFVINLGYQFGQAAAGVDHNMVITMILEIFMVRE